MRGNTITINMVRGVVAQTGNLFQYDYGQRLILAGLTLPSSYEVHFGNDEDGESKTMIGDSSGVDIPDEFLLNGEDIHVWLYLHEGASDGETEYHGIIRVTRRAKPTNQEPTPVQQDVIDQTIAALNAGVAEVERIAEEMPEEINTALAEAKASGEFDGFSPLASVSKEGPVATISITDKNHTTEATITDGNDGFSPIASVSKVENIATITIIDRNGTTRATIRDGVAGDIIDDASGAGDTDKTWSSNKLAGELEKKYEKPGTGIPASDIASGVIPDISGKADKSEIGVVPAGQTVEGQISNLGGALDRKYEKPATGIPASDIAAGVIPDVSEKLDVSEKGAPNGVAELDGSGKVLSSQLPSYVDDVEEYAAMVDFPRIGENGKIYIAINTNKTYRWGGTTYVEISESLALGETSSTAYRGDRGAEAYAASVTNVETSPTENSTNLITSGAVYTGLATKADKSEIPTAPVQDVQVNGTSVLNDGVANVPVASASNLGAVKIPTNRGLYIDSSGSLSINRATESTIKTGTNQYYPITPYEQHNSAFYGLAKAAGDSTQSASSNPVGTYTESAKASIRSMIGAENGDDIIKVQDTQPTTPATKIWMPETAPTGIQVPTYEEHQALNSAISEKYTKPQNGIPASDLESGVIPSVPVQDVQVNGASILDAQGKANIPYGTASKFGVLAVGNGLRISGTNYKALIDNAGSAKIKAGTEAYNPIVPLRQDESVFYGLAKAAGADMASLSGETVGVYPEAQRSAISQMLDAPETVSGSTPSITAKPGVRYVCGECSTLSFTPSATGVCDVMFTSGATPTVLTLPNTVKFPDAFDPSNLDANTTYEINILNGVYGLVSAWT